jgi:hypothetical protein
VKIIALFLMLTLLITSCTDKGEDIPQEEISPDRELFVFPSAEVSPSSVDTEGEMGDDDDNAEFGNTYNRDEPIDNPMLRYLGDLEAFPPAPFDVDLDFTAFECGWEFDEAFSDLMFMHSNDFIGKTIRIVGPYTGFFYDEFDRYFHFVLVDDAEGCCIRYIEFTWSEDNYPDEYPDEDAVIDVIGVFNSYYVEEWAQTEHFLVVDNITILHGGIWG